MSGDYDPATYGRPVGPRVVLGDVLRVLAAVYAEGSRDQINRKIVQEFILEVATRLKGL